MTDLELLRDYAANGSNEAFHLIVQRHLGVVRGTALRQLRNDHHADEVSHAVFLALAIGMWFVFTRTRLGMMIRAGSTNREMVQSLGIDITFLYRVVFAAGVALAVLAGMVAAPVSSVYPGMGNQVLIICFVVVVIGGIGSIRGALLASLLIGIVDTFGKVFVPQAAGVLVYVLMALILLWRPDGLFKAG